MSYRSVPLKRLFEQITRLRGLDPVQSAITAGQRARTAELITDRLRIAWEAELWPELLVTERRQYAPDYDVAETVSARAVRFYDDEVESAYFISLQNANVGNEPSFEGATDWWRKAVAGTDYLPEVAYQQEWATTEIGHVDVKRGVFASDPRLTIGLRPLNGCRIVYAGAVLVADTHLDVDRPWLTFRPPSPQVTLDPHRLALPYAEGALAYDEVTGDCYKAIAAVPANTAISSADHWQRVRVPLIFAEYIKHAVVADFAMEDQGRLRSEARANEELDRVRDVQFEQSGQIRKATFGRRV